MYLKKEMIKIASLDSICEGENCLIFGVNNFIGKNLIDFLKSRKVKLALIDIQKYQNEQLGKDEDVIYKTINSGDEESVNQVISEINKEMGKIDYVICNYYIEDIRNKLDNSKLSFEIWDNLLEEWCLNYFLVLKATAPHLEANRKGRIVFFNSTRGYTGEGEGGLSLGGSIYEAGCSSAITGMMTSIARSIIPKGISVNGISVGNSFEEKWDEIQWALGLWLSGLGEYSCGEIYRVY